MPKAITKKQRLEIIEYANTHNQTAAAKHFKVSRMFVNSIVNKRQIKTTRGRDNFSVMFI